MKVTTVILLLALPAFAGGIVVSDRHLVPDSYPAPRIEQKANGSVIFHPARPASFRTVSYGVALGVRGVQVSRRSFSAPRPQASRDTSNADSQLFGFQSRKGTVFLARKGELLTLGSREYKVLGQKASHVYLRNLETGKVTRARATQ